MSSNMLEAMKNLRQNLHHVGNLNNWKKKHLNQGAVATEDIDNYMLVSLGFNAVSGERECTRVVDVGTKGYLVATPEDYMEEYETISSFYNGIGERAGVVKMDIGMRFECSNFLLEDENQPVNNGNPVYYEPARHAFVVANVTNGPIGRYQLAANKLVVVDANPLSIDGRRLIRFEVTQ